jgi:hypothetical protein
MGYRDEGEAALHRVQSLETRVAELEGQLAQANAEIVRLHGKPIEPPPSPMATLARVAYSGWLGVALLALGYLAWASYRSETKGVEASLVVLPLCAALIGAWRSRQRSVAAIVVLSLAWALATFCALFVFFATLWRSL